MALVMYIVVGVVSGSDMSEILNYFYPFQELALKLFEWLGYVLIEAIAHDSHE